MKNLFCKRLAAYLRITQSPSPSVELPLTKRHNFTITNHINDDHPAISENEATNELLRRICDLLETRIRSEEEQRYEDDKENEMKNDWMLAAAVLDRICAITITVFFVVGTVLIFAVCIFHT